MKTRSTKQPRINRSFIASLSRTLALATLSAMGLSSAQATDFNWDPDQTGTTFGGGTNSWNLIDFSWWDDVGATQSVWPNLNTDKAIFGNAGGTVTISTGTGVIANAVSFTGGGYTLAGATGTDVLTLDGAAPSVAVSGTNTATINAIIAGTVGFTKSGTGTLVLGGASTVSGGVSITGGTVRIGLAGALGANDVTVGTGALLETNLASPTLTNGIVLNGGTYRYGGLGTNSITALKAVNLTGNGTINLVNAGVNGKLLLGTGQLVSSAATTLTKTGNGVLQLSGANTGFQSDVALNAGLVEFQHVDALGSGTQTITVGSGAEFVASNATVRHNFTANSGSILSANGPGAGNYSGTVTLNGTVNANPRLFQNIVVATGMKFGGTLAGSGTLNVNGVAPSLQGVGTATGVSNVYITGNNTGFTGAFNVTQNGRISVAPTAAIDPLGAQVVNLSGGTLAVAPDVSGGALANAGLFGRYYNHAQLASALIGGFDFGLATPAATRTDTTINFPNFLTAGLPAGPANTNLGISWAGVLKITAGGDYAFNTASDDGSMLYIDGSPVVANDAAQGTTTRGGSINLSAGFHSIVIKYAQGGGGTTMISNYSGPDTANATVILGSVANTLTSNGTGIVGSASVDNALTVSAGTVGTVEAVAANITSSGTVNIGNAGTFSVTGQSGSETVTQTGAVTLNGRAFINTGFAGASVQFGASGADLTISGDVNESGTSSLVKTGGRTLTLNGAYNWTGSTTVVGGTLSLNKPLPATSALTIINNGTVANYTNIGITGSGTFALSNNVAVYGGSATGTNTFGGQVDLGGAARTFTTWGQGNTILGAVISNGDIVKNGLGLMTLNTASPAWAGAVTVNSGKVSVSNATGLGSAATGTTVNSGGYVEIANVSVAEPFTINGMGQPLPFVANAATASNPPSGMSTGALLGNGGIAGTITGNILLGSNSGIGALKGSALTISGVISDGGSAYSLTKTGGDLTTGATPATIGAGGTLVLTGANTYTGATIIQAGELRLANAGGQAIQSSLVRIGTGLLDATLTLGASNQMPTNVIIDFANGNRNSKFQLNGFNQTIGGFANTSFALPIIQNFETAGAGTSVLTVNNATDTSFSGLIRNSTGTLALTKTGAGTLTISGNGMFGTNNVLYSGATSVTGGKLVFSDTTSTITSPLTISGTGSVEFNESYGRTTIYQAAIVDNGLGFTKTGKGNLTINTLGTVTGTINVNEGVLNLTDAGGNVNPLPGAPINVAAGAQVQMFGVTAVTTTFNNNITLNGLSQGGALSGAVAGGTPTNTFTGTLTLAATSNISTGWSDKVMNWTGPITGAGGLVIDKLHYTQQPGVFNITNVGNNYTGGTTLNSGTVQFSAGALPSGNLKFGGTFGNAGNFGTGQLVLSATAGSTFNRALGTGSGQVQFTGDGGGFTAIGAAATVDFGGAGATIDWQASGGFDANSSLVMNTGTGANNAITVNNGINLNSGVRRIMDNTNNITYAGVISGTSELILEGAGVHRFIGAGANTYTGLTNVSGGALTLNRTGGNAINGDIQISNNQGATRRIVFLGASDQIADTATVSFLGSSGNNGDLRLFGFNETVAGINDRSGGGVIEVADVAGEINNAGKTIAAADVSTLTVNATADSFYNGFLRNNSAGGATVITGALSLVKNGAGTLTISQGQQSGNGNQSYSGTTTINAGSVVYANVGTINSPTIVNAGSVGFLTNLNQSLTNGQVISGAGNLVKSGTGTQILSGALAYSGATTVNAGILNITGTTNASHNGAYTVNAGGILLVGNGTGGGILTGNNAITVNAGGVVAFSRNNAYDFAGIVSGAGDVQSRAGATGTILSGANTYSGSTTVFAGSTLGLAGSGASAGGLNVSNGGLLTLDFNLAGSNAAGIVAATAPVNLNGGTLTIAGSGAANTQALGALNLGTALLSGFQGLSPTQTGSGNSAINFNSGAGGLTVSLGAITHSIGGTANIALPASGSVTTSGTAIGGIANGFTTTSGGTTWLAQDGGGVITPLATFGTDTFGAGINTDVTTTGAGASTNSIRFNTAAANTLTLTGANTVDSGGILVTTAVGANASTITGGTIAGSASAGLTLIQNNTGAGLTISSGVVDNGGATGLTKAGAGTVTLNGSNTYTGATFVSQGTLITLGTTGNGLTTVGTAGTLQIGDGTTNGIFPTNLAPVGGTLTVANATAQTLPAYQGDINLRMLQNGISNPTSFQTGTFQKIAGGTLTINNTLATGNFHPRAGTTVLDTGADVRVGGFSSVGLSSGDNGTLTAKGAGRFTANGDFNVGDVAGTRGTLNIQDQAVATIATFYVGKGVNGIGVVNQTLGSVVNTGGGDWRFGGGGSAADSAAYGIYNLSGGSFQTSRNFQTGSFGIGIFNQTGGNVSITGGTPDTGRFAGSFGLLNVSGGVYTHNTTSNFISGENGVGTVNVSGAGQFIMANVATANIGLALGGASATGTVNLLAGGLIQVGMVRDFDASTATQSNFNFNGGTLRVTTATANAGAFMTGLTAATVYSGGANIDTNGVAITIAQPLIAPGGSGLTAIPVGAGGSGYVGEPIVNITGGGGVGATARAIVVGGVITGFTITNPGTGYTGAPTVTLLGGGATSLGTAGTATIAANATTGGLNKLNTGTLTLTGASTYGGATTITGGSIAVTNTAAGTNLLLPGTSLVLNGGSLALTGAAALANTQTFAGGTTINAPGTVSSTIGAGGTNIVNLGAITRTAGGAADFSGNGVINTLTANTATSILGGWATFGNGNNWAVSAGTGVASGAITALGTYTTNTWAAGNNTDMTTAGTVTNLTTNSVRFNTATPVTVTISGTDTITSGGILIPAAATTAATIFTGGTLATGTNTDLVVNHFGGGTATIASVIAANGTGGLVKAGGGVLILGNVTNTYNGNTVIGAGTLRLGGANNVQIPNGAGKGNVVINAGATLDLNGFDEQINGLSGYGTVTSGINSNKTLTVGDNNVSSTFSGVYLNGTSTANVLTKIGTGTLTLDNIAPGTYTGATNINGGAIKLATPQALANNTTINVNAANGLLFDTTVPVISGLGGNSNFALQTTATSPAPNVPVQLTIGNNNAGGTFTGALTGTGTLIKSGTGIQLLNGTNTNTGGVIVNGGTLVMGGTNSGTSGLMIVNSGTLQVNSAGAIYGASGRNILVATGGVVTAQAFSANSASTGFGTYPTTSFTSLLSRVDQGSTGVLGLQTDGSLQAPITENLDLAAQGSNLSIGSLITGTGGLGNAPVQYTGIITPNQNTFRIGGGTGRLILPNAATLSGANSLVLYGSASTGGLVYLTGKYGFTGQTIVNNGTTYITNLANGGVASSLGASSSAASNLVLNGGTLSYIGAGGSTDRLVTLGTSTPVLDSSGSGAVNFTGTGAAGFLNSGNRTWILQGTNTGGNSVAAAITDSTLIAGTNGTLNHGITTLQKNGNGTWIISGTNSFSGGTNINNGVLQFNSAASIGANSVNGPATILAGVNGAVALGGSLTTGIQATLNRVSPLSAGTVALTADSAEGINFDGGSAGASLPTAYLGAYGNATYTGALTPFGSIYRLGGGGGVLTMPSGGLSGPRQVIIGGGGPIPLAGAFNVVNPGAGFYQNPNLNGQVTLGGTSDYSGGTIISTGSILSATNVAALGSGPLKFQGGVYRAIDTTDITLASDGVSAREIRIGTDTSAIVQTANVDVIGGVSTTFSKTFGILPALGSNQGQSSFTKFGGGSLTLANGINLPTTNGSNTVATNSGTLIIERGTLSIGANPTNFVGNIQVGSNAGGVATLKLVTNNVFGNTAAQYGAANVVDIYNGSKLDLNGYSDTIRNIRGMGSIVNTGAGSPTLTTGTVASENMIWGGNLEGNFVLKRAGNLASQFGTTANSNGIELFNNYNPNFTGKFVADSAMIRFRADGTLGSTSEAFAADKITLNNGAAILAAGGVPLVLGANRGITLGSGGGSIWSFGSVPLVVNGPITGAGSLSILDDAGTVMLGSDNNTWTGGTTINSNAAGRGMLSIGAGGATGSLPAGDVFFNSAAGAARLYVFKTTAQNIPNTINGPGLILQIGSGTTTLSGVNNTGQTTFIGGGKLRADFSGGNQPIGAGTSVQVGAGTFEYVGASGDNIARLGTINATSFGMPYQYLGGSTGDAMVQSTYGGSGTQTLQFSGIGRGAGSTLNFNTNGGVNGVSNIIGFTAGVTTNQVINASFFYNGGEFAAYDQNGFVRAVQATDLNGAADNAIIGGRYLRLTAAQTGQAGLGVPGINFVGAASGFALNAAQTLTLNGNPGTLLKSGGGTAIVGGGAGATIGNNAQELIVRTDTATDVLQVDVPITGTGALTKSGDGQLTLTAANSYTGQTFVNSGSVVVTGNGVLGSLTAAASVRIANAMGSTASVTINSATAVINAGANTAGDVLRIGEGGNGTLTQSAGTVNGSQYVTIGENQGAVGTYNMSGGTLNVKLNNSNSPSLIVGRAGTGTMNISGTASVNILQGGQFQIASGAANPGQFQGLVPNAGLSTGVGTVTQTGGTVTVATNNGVYQSNAIGAVIIGVDGTGTYNLNGGTLITPILARGNGTANFNFGGGTLRAPANIPTLPQSIFNVDLATNFTGTGVGKGTIDTNGNDVALAGPLSGAGGFAKSSAGVLTVHNANNTYAGGTDINAGTIVASANALGTGIVTVGGGSTLQVQGQQTGLLGKFYVTQDTAVTPGVTTGGTPMAVEFASLGNFNAFTAGKALVAAESTAARGKVSVNYLDLGGANGNTALPPQLIALQAGVTFITRLDGKFAAATAGDYTFQGRSDDETLVWVDGQPVLDNNRDQGQNIRSGTIALTAGAHDITIGYRQGVGGGGFSIGVTQPGQGQSFQVGSELNMSNALLSFGSNDLTVGGLAGSGDVQTVAGGTITDNVGAADAPNFSGALIGSEAFLKSGLGKQILSGLNPAFTGAVSVTDGNLEVSGAISGSAVTVNGAGAVLGGDGAVGALIVTSGTVAPGNSGIGSLDSLNFSLGAAGTTNFEIGSPTMYDSLNVAGTVTLGGNLAAIVGAGPFGFSDVFTVINNDGADAVIGTYAGISEGGLFSASGYDFTVSYVGGDGNDVTLTIPEPGSAALLLGGIAMLAGRRRRNNRA